MFAELLALASMAASGTVAYAGYASYLTVAAMVVGVYTAREQRAAAQRALKSKVADRNVMVREATANRPHLFGRVRTSGQVQFPGSSGTYNEKMHFCLALGDEIDAVEQVWFGDKPLAALDADGWTTEPPFARSRAVPETFEAVVTAGWSITLPHLAWQIHAVSGIASDMQEPTAMTLGNPTSSGAQYSYATVGGVTVVTVNASWQGVNLVITYSRIDTTTVARAKAFLGASGQAADPYLISEMGGTWSPSDKFTGTSYISGTWVYDPDIYATGILDVSAVVRGEKCYDPRTATTVWTRNPALIAWRLISKAYPSETYDSAALIAAANVCDEWVLVDPDKDAGDFEIVSSAKQQRRYTFDDVISSETSTKDALERIVQSMAGSAVRVAGTWYIWAGAWDEPTLALDVDDLAPGEIVVQGVAEDGVLFNGISGRYTNSTSWVEDSFPVYVSPAYVALDAGETEILDVDLTQITDVHRAQRVARLMLHKARQALTFSCSVEMSAYSLYPGKMVTWTIDRYGWDAKPFRCLSRVYSPAAGVIQCVFQEDAEDIYASGYSELTNPDPSPNTNLPDPFSVEAPVLTFGTGAEFVALLADGSQRPFVRVYWQRMDESAETVEVWWRRADLTSWQTTTVAASAQFADLHNVAANETCVVQARALNGIGVRSAWTVSTVTVDATTPANFVGRGMIATPMIAASAATDVYAYGYTGAPITVGIGASTADDTAITDNYLIVNDGTESITVVITGQVMLTVTGTAAKAYLTIEMLLNCTAGMLDNPTYDSWYNWEGYSITPLQASGTVAHTLTITRSIVLVPDDPLDANEIHSVGVRLSAFGDTGCSSVTASGQTLRIEVVKR